MVDTFTLQVTEEQNGTRIDSFLAAETDGVSRSYLQKLIADAQILVNDKTVKSNYKVKTGDVLQVTIPEAAPIDILPEEMDLNIIYEDSDLLVVNKPIGLVVHPANGHYSGTLVNGLLAHCNDLSGINGKMRPGIVHRIDKDTSGVLMIAKNDMAHQSLAAQLAEHSITRKYNAVVYNGFNEDEGTVNQPIGRNPQDRKKMAVTQKHSRHAVTHYRVIERMEKFTLIEAQLETGRTHQIRVHMTHIGHPLLGDPVYGPKKQPISLEGQALHARVLGFIHPRTGEYMEFEAPLPRHFEALLERLRK